MPLEIIGEGLVYLVKVFVRFMVSVFVELILNLLIKGPGILIWRCFGYKALDDDSTRVILTGLLFWVLVVLAAVAVLT